MFIASSQQLFGIDKTTAGVTSALSRAASVGDLEADLVVQGASRLAARNYAINYLSFWSRQGLLQVEFEKHDGSPPHSYLVKIAERVIRISCYDEGSAPPNFAHVSCLRLTGGHDFIALRSSQFRQLRLYRRTGENALVFDPGEAVPALKGHLTDEITENLGTCTALHGALLANRSGAVLLCGSPGSDKTTLAFAMMQRGFQSHADGAITGEKRSSVRGRALRERHFFLASISSDIL
ncbi:hypothetical protein [Ensifer sp. NM-2]|uniref:hypothetical protein n=1 Tax=Ensifer sp. NM-2 TaxID=2109730 RepID=UPI0011B1E4F2|nr:hypothetical protein [Ensifer sp. NM-2]